MFRAYLAPFLLAALAATPAPTQAAPDADCVVLLHGLVRSDTSLLILQETLEAQGYVVANSDYDSTEGTVEDLAQSALPPMIEACGSAPTIHFVTHSMGGILLRQWLADNDLPRLGRTVMMAPPNKGSEIVDQLGEIVAFEWINGPAGMELGTDGIATRLGPVWPDVGIIAGTRSLNPVYSAMLPGPDDGKVSAAATQVEGMTDYIELGVTHTFMMNQPVVIAEVLTFLRTGRFDHEMTLARAVEMLAEPL